MNRSRIDGISSVAGGVFDELYVDGIGKLKDDSTANKLNINGIFTAKGSITADEAIVEGVAKFENGLRIKRGDITGVVNVRGAFNATAVNCEGVISCDGEFSVDYLFMNGVCKLNELYGDEIIIDTNAHKNSGFEKFLSGVIEPLFGRNAPDRSKAKHIECTSLTASRLTADVVMANRVRLTNHCHIGKLYCSREFIETDDTCRIDEIIEPDTDIQRQNNR